MWQNQGNWSFAMYDYWIEGINGRLDDPNIPKMMDLIDPYTYRQRLMMPKMLISATGDEFMQPDDTYYFWDDLPEPKYFRLLANTDHTTVLNGLSAPHFVFSFRQLLLATWKEYHLPRFSWNRFDDPEKKTGGITLTTDTPVKQIYGWVGDTRNQFRRDYRLLGLKGNHLGDYWTPEMPQLPDGYPGKAPKDRAYPSQNRILDADISFQVY